MILPIYVYGQPILRKVAIDIEQDNYPNLQELINNMFETMYHADGVGLAAPQVGLNDRIFVVDLSVMGDEVPEMKGFKKTFINPHIIERTGDLKEVEEGCLSIPGIHEKVPREERIRIQYIDENLESQDEEYVGFTARCIQHEYDHLDGVMFVDKISPLRKQLVKSKLTAMTKGKVSCSYKVKTLK
ncbi:MAG: peptide deformylase [Dysgonamonadaceae bacterium]|jgi:peptide deformylase|nr:peptide deformylase [Dysgonamonadaceae bacterium]MDD3308471.1 peptide deformylase [Dysgonamonadaceae bacterium]MDD3899667.1 peptide deformylase [Dysgonamonadaceae bacterium]MDD4398180.1 peptide deformylase [Dysgonamonadaceae bacterium]MEA5081830.1 peptide deformylase [Dysgonamonadaceae bacterium]